MIADAMMHHEGWRPGSRSYRNRNPGNLRAGVQQLGTDDGGYSIFANLTEGYQALLSDLRAKFTGHTHTGLTPDSTFLDFIEVYAPAEDHNDDGSYFQDVKNWFQVATGRTLTPDTLLKDI